MVKYIAKDLVKKIKSAGFIEVNIVGDHHVFKNMQNGKKVSVPYARRKDTIAVGTAHNILKVIDDTENK